MSVLIQNTTEIRSFNTKKIIEFLRFNDFATKKELADKLNLSFATVSNICNQLVAEDLLERTTSSSSNGGRIPELLSINPKSKYFLCIDLVKSGIAEIAIVNLKNSIIETMINILDSESINNNMQAIYEQTIKFTEKLGISLSAILGIGVSVSGIFNHSSSKIVNSTNPIFENQPLKDMIFDLFNIPVYIENESNLLAVAAVLHSSKEHKYKDLIYIYIEEGVGVGIISHGELVTGHRGLGGEICHMPIGNDSYSCYCGNTGCVESELSLRGFLRKYRDLSDSKLLASTEVWEALMDKVDAGDEAALKLIEENGKLLGRLISILQNIFDTEVFYIGGLTAKLYDAMYGYMILEAKSRTLLRNIDDFTIKYSSDYLRLTIIGCGELVFKNWNP